jgi:hypothetical protein
MPFDSKYIAAGFSVVLLLGGVYLKFFYDVPDALEVINIWVSWGLILLGVVGLIVSLLWKKARNPLLV